MKKTSRRTKHSIHKARNVVVVHSEKKDPPDLNRLAKALIGLKLAEAHAAKQALKSTKSDQ